MTEPVRLRDCAVTTEPSREEKGRGLAVESGKPGRAEHACDPGSVDPSGSPLNSSLVTLFSVKGRVEVCTHRCEL